MPQPRVKFVFISSPYHTLPTICVLSSFSVLSENSTTMSFLRASTIAALLFATTVILVQPASALRCPRGTFRVGKGCHLCKPGTYQDKPNRFGCKKCPGGTFTRFYGVRVQDLCLPCKPSQFSRMGSSKCSNCPKGQVYSCKKCIRCPPGTSLTYDGCECKPCESGYFSTKANQETCTECPNRQDSNKDRTGCTRTTCKPGFERDYSSCQKCQYNEYRSASTDQCEECPRRTVTNNFNGPNSKCIRCPPGTFITDLLKETTTNEQVPYCEKCAPGTNTKGFSKALCRQVGKPCPKYAFVDKEGDCDGCEANYRLDVAEKKCVRCPNNAISAGGVTTRCTPCGKGGEQGPYNRCVCKPGWDETDGKCKKCPAGSFRGRGDYGCEKCEEGFFSQAGATRCKKCARGTMNAGDGNSRCIKKPKCRKKYIVGYESASYFPRTVCVSGKTGCPYGLRLTQRRGKFWCVNQRGDIVCPKGQRYYYRRNECA